MSVDSGGNDSNHENEAIKGDNDKYVNKYDTDKGADEDICKQRRR